MSSRRPQDAWKASAANGQPTRAAGRSATRKPGGAWRWVWAAVVLAAIAGVVAGLFLFLRPDPVPVLLALPITQYDHPDWSPNPWAEADARGLRDQFKGGGEQAFGAQDKDRIRRKLNEEVDATRGHSRPLVVYISALGTVADGKPFLLPGDARPDDPTNWMPLGDLLELLRRSDAPRLLILDIRPVRSPRSVLPIEDVNDVIDAALAKLDQSNDLPYWVISAHNPCTGPNVIRPLKRTTFGLAIAQAAAGSADGWNPERTKDRRVSAEEFLHYAREVTHALSATPGLSPQLPRVHGKGKNFILLQVPKDGPAALPTLPDPEPNPAWLSPASQQQDKWIADKLHRRAPRLTHHYTLAASRAERHWLAGDDATIAAAKFQEDAKRLRDEGAKLIVPPPLVRSLARARLNPALNVAASDAILRPIFRAIRENGGIKRDAKEDKLLEAIKAIRPKVTEPAPFDATAAAIFDFALELGGDATPGHIAYLADLLGTFTPKPHQAELVTLELIAGLPLSLSQRWKPAGAIRTVLMTVQAAEAAVVFDGRCLPWLQAKLEATDQARWKAMKVLCDPESSDQAIRDAVAGLEQARKDYAAIAAAATVLMAALTEYEETRAVLADLTAAFPFEAVGAAEEVASSWVALVEDVLRLQAMLYPASAPDLSVVGEVDRLRDRLKGSRQRIHGLIRVPPQTAGPRQLEDALRWPHWTGKERSDLLARLDATSRDVAGRMLSTWPMQPSGRDPGTPEKCSARVAADSARDVRRLVDLLRIAGHPDAAELTTKAGGVAANPAEVPDLFRRARAAWRVGLVQQYRDADVNRQALIGWLVDPDDVPAYPRPDSVATLGPPNPEFPRIVAAELRYHEWLGQVRYTGEANALQGIPYPFAADHAKANRELAAEFAVWVTKYRTPGS